MICSHMIRLQAITNTKHCCPSSFLKPMLILIFKELKTIRNGTTPLFVACQNGYTNTVALLLEANANPNLQRTRDNLQWHNTSLCWMVTLTLLPSFFKPMLILIFSRDGRIPKSQSKSLFSRHVDKTPSTLEGGTDIIKLFLEANANPDYFEKLDYFVHDWM